MNISITNDCNRRCQYCFQKDWYLPKKINDHEQIREMSIDEFKDLIVWVMKSERMQPNLRIALMGGEPLMHPQFVEFVNVLRQWNLEPLIISNISIDSQKFEQIIPSLQDTHWMINTDYPDIQRDTFITNFTTLCKSSLPIGLSTTLLPNSNEINKSADRILELVQIYKDIHGSIDQLGVRLSPYSPNPCGTYTPYDFSLDIVSFLNTVWSLGKLNTNFDCRMTYCELSENAIDQFKLAGIELSTTKCSGDRMPFDVLVDGSCIWCSSANFLRLNHWRDYPNFNAARQALIEQWNGWWRRTEIKCDYKNCGKFNPALCHGNCIAKNEFYTNKYESTITFNGANLNG